MRARPASRSFHRRYQILEQLGQGGMGMVYRSKDRLDGFVALKRLVKVEQLAKMMSRSFDAGDFERSRSGSLRDVLDTMPMMSVEPNLTSSALRVARSEHAHAITAPSGPGFIARSIPVEATASLSPGLTPDYDDSVEHMSTASARLRLALAQEFHTLASVRHPNIISVLDYGFDDAGQPYFTMELLEGARSILEAGWELPKEARCRLLEQMLQALLYLHRRGLIHRDLKPGNVLVQGDRVKVVDFGLAILLEHVREGDGLAGTPLYMAPELFAGQLPSESTDLYAAGALAYELFTGRQLYGMSDILRIARDPSAAPPDMAPLDPRLAPIVGRLLARKPCDRYASAADVIAALRQATGLPLTVETKATRESFLQAARLVGRDPELTVLTGELEETMLGQGSSWLIGGESGVGKSRLIDELRARALVAGAVVMRGQEVSEGAAPYQLWHDVLRWLALLTDPTDAQASVLKPLVPDIAALLGREIPDPDAVEPDAAQGRLARTVEDLMRRHDEPALILLEDLHWARSDSLKLLGHLTEIVPELRVLIVASYRDDERPALPSELPRMRPLKLARLAPASVKVLVESMVGTGTAGLDDRLVRETEGNPFFLVEVVRALAEEAGQLDRVGAEQLPEGFSSQGMKRIIMRRIGRVPAPDRPLLEAAAVAGRQIDEALLRAVAPEVDLDAWLAACTVAAVLDVHEGRFRFAHDKLREGLLDELDEAAKKSLHRKVAIAIEAVYPGSPAQTAALAHHWAMAGDHEKAAHYCGLAGEQALQSSAYREAVELFERALSMTEDRAGAAAAPAGAAAPTSATERLRALRRALSGVQLVPSKSDRFRRARWQGLLSEAYARLGEQQQGLMHGHAALQGLGLRIPEGNAAISLGLMGEAVIRGAQSAWPAAFAEDEDARVVLVEAARIHNRLTETYIYLEASLPMLWSGLRTLHIGESAGPSPELARCYTSMGVVAGIMRLHGLAKAWCGRGVELITRVGKPYDVAWVLQRDSVYRLTVGEWQRAETQLQRAVEIATRSGDRRQWEESKSILGFGCSYQGRFQEGFDHLAAAFESGRRRGDKQVMTWGAQGQAWCAIHLGRTREVAGIVEQARSLVESGAVAPDVMNNHGILALYHFHLGEREAALSWAGKALDLIGAKTPMAYWVKWAIEAVSFVLVSLWQEAIDRGAPLVERQRLEKMAVKACSSARSFAQIFAICRPYAGYIQGLLARARGGADTRKARRIWDKAMVDAEQLDMPYERGLLHIELGKVAPKGSHERRAHLQRAEEILSDLEVPYELEQARAALEGRAT